MAILDTPREHLPAGITVRLSCECKQCGVQPESIIQPADMSHLGLYCPRCKGWIKWIGKRSAWFHAWIMAPRPEVKQ